jgi:hypothetical protein
MDREMLMQQQQQESAPSLQHQSTLFQWAFGDIWGVIWGFLHPFHNLCWGVKITEQCSDGTVQEWAALAAQTLNNAWYKSRIQMYWVMLLCGEV